MDIHKKKPKKFKSSDDKFPRPSETVVATCVKRDSFFFAGFALGKWNKATLRSMFNQIEDYIQQPTSKRKLEIYSDGNDDYISVLQEYFHKDSLCYGQKIKSKDGKKIFPAIRRKIFGNPNQDEIETNTNECFNTILRNRLSRLVRKTQCHAKQKYALNDALFLFQFYWNFMHLNEKNRTPAILEKQTNKSWTWGMFLHAKLRYFS